MVYNVFLWCSCTIHVMFYHVFCDVHVVYMWCSTYFCDIHILYMGCSTYFRMFIYYKCMFHDFFKFPWDILCYILDCLSNIHVMIFFNLPLLRGFFFSLVICPMLLFCYFFHVMLLSGLHHVPNSYGILFCFLFALI